MFRYLSRDKNPEKADDVFGRRAAKLHLYLKLPISETALLATSANIDFVLLANLDSVRFLAAELPELPEKPFLRTLQNLPRKHRQQNAQHRVLLHINKVLKHQCLNLSLVTPDISPSIHGKNGEFYRSAMFYLLASLHLPACLNSPNEAMT